MVNLGKLFGLITSPGDFCNVLRYPVPANGELTLCFDMYKGRFVDGCYFSMTPYNDDTPASGSYLAQPDFSMLPKGWDKYGARKVLRSLYAQLYGSLSECFDPAPIMPVKGVVIFEIVIENGTIHDAIYTVEVEPE